MIEHALAILEFDRVRANVAALAAGEHARSLIMNAPLFYSHPEAATELEKVCAVRRILDEGKSFPPLPETDLT